MLKKVSHFILSALLLVSTMGMAVSKHYCGDNLVSVSLFEEADSCCGDADCCHNENQNYKVKDDFSLPQISNVPVLTQFDIFEYRLINEHPETREPKNTIPVFSDSPPPPTIQKTLALKQLYLL